ncbi:MAG: polysaccharide deacetylase family protein [Myxococcales bacterium]|nr:polysaccharide deacetylase family protein [Myxococcales bacterium]
MERLCAVSVDLDGIDCYRALHDLEPRSAGARAIYDRAIGRAAAFAAGEGIPLTFFAIGRDLLEGAQVDRLRAAVGERHEVENHSLSHRYDLSRAPRAAIAEELEEASRLIAEATGRRPQGFRAPGYTLSDALLDAVQDAGLRFDASVFPSAPYLAAKTAALAALALRGRRSVALPANPRVLLAPRGPYHPGRAFHRRGDRALLELPVTVSPGLGLPFIGTALSLAGPRGAAWLAARCASRRFVSLELHGLDFLSEADELADLAPHQPDLRVPLARKKAALTAALAVLRQRGHRFVTLAGAAEAYTQ